MAEYQISGEPQKILPGWAREELPPSMYESFEGAKKGTEEVSELELRAQQLEDEQILALGKSADIKARMRVVKRDPSRDSAKPRPVIKTFYPVKS